ncbi:hypothetical protein [Sphingorhabdus lutea]|nr:hypothetical protein [Sphingorhabdus lutea]
MVQDEYAYVGRGEYWKYFFTIGIVSIGLLVGMIFCLLSLELLLTLILGLALFSLGIYFRIIMARRCRDIGWPVELVWISCGFQIFLGFVTQKTFDPNIMQDNPPSIFILLLVFSDLFLAIIIGCIAGPDRGRKKKLAGINSDDLPSKYSVYHDLEPSQKSNINRNEDRWREVFYSQEDQRKPAKMTFNDKVTTEQKDSLYLPNKPTIFGRKRT